MKKKIHPKDQTEELRKAHDEFAKRNPKGYREFYLDAAEDHSNLLLDSFTLAIEDMVEKGKYKRYKKFHKETPNNEWIHKEWRDQILKDADFILDEIIPDQPASIRIITINLERTKEAIMAELDGIVTNALQEYEEIWSRITEHGKDGNLIFVPCRIKERLKWLPIYEELLEVWDLYEKAGQQPWLKTFRFIAKKVGRPLSTVKSQWYLAYEKIFGEKYTPEKKYTTEEKRGDADKLCASCPYGAMCYRSGDWYPCKEYLSIAGKQKSVKLTEYDDNVLYNQPIHDLEE